MLVERIDIYININYHSLLTSNPNNNGLQQMKEKEVKFWIKLKRLNQITCSVFFYCLNYFSLWYYLALGTLYFIFLLIFRLSLCSGLNVLHRKWQNILQDLIKYLQYSFSSSFSFFSFSSSFIIKIHTLKNHLIFYFLLLVYLLLSHTI